MFIGDQRQSNYFRSGVEKVNGEYQGWCVDFLRGLDSGPVKMSFDSKVILWSVRWGEVGSVKEEKELPFNMWNGMQKDSVCDSLGQFNENWFLCEIQGKNRCVQR